MKKGSLNLSIQAIVIIVLAMTILSLGLVFVRSQFKDLSKISTEVQGEIRKQILDDLRTRGDKISFSDSVQLSTKEESVLAVGVQNVEDERIYFGLNVYIREAQSDHELDEYDLRYLDQHCDYFLDPSEADVLPINVKAPRTAGTDTFIVEIVLGDRRDCDPDSVPENAGDDGGDGDQNDDEESLDGVIYAKTSSFFTVR